MFALNFPVTKDYSFETPPTFSVPLKMHNSPESYECYMSCAVTGNPRPHVTWYRNNVSLNTNTNYYITNTCGVCSMVILKVGPKDNGDYTVIAENLLGRVECSTKLVVKGKNTLKKCVTSYILLLWLYILTFPFSPSSFRLGWCSEPELLKMLVPFKWMECKGFVNWKPVIWAFFCFK